MAEMVRKCAQCGTVDRKFSWKSVADATGNPEFERPWTCGSCAWTEFELVSSDAEAESSRSSGTEAASRS